MKMRKLGILIYRIFFILLFSEFIFTNSEAKNEKKITFIAVGDVLLDRGVAETLKGVKPEDALKEIIPVLKKGDIVFCNLECPFVSNPAPLPKPVSFSSSPSMVSVLKIAGFNIISLANNHTMDCGKAGLLETMENLEKQKIAFCGAGRNKKEAHSPFIFKIKGICIGFLAYCDFSPEGIIRLSDAPTIAVIDEDTLSREIKIAKSKVDILVVSFHWGTEFYPLPTARQKRIAEESIDAGADIIIGHHPHVVQPTEIKKQKSGRKSLIVYSLGNFMFDTTKEKSNESIILECILTKNGIEQIKTYPVKIKQGIPVLLQTTDK